MLFMAQESTAVSVLPLPEKTNLTTENEFTGLEMGLFDLF
jgi:hypothetical protein